MIEDNKNIYRAIIIMLILFNMIVVYNFNNLLDRKEVIIKNQLHTIEYLMVGFEDRKLIKEANDMLHKIKDTE